MLSELHIQIADLFLDLLPLFHLLFLTKISAHGKFLQFFLRLRNLLLNIPALGIHCLPCSLLRRLRYVSADSTDIHVFSSCLYHKA